MLKIVNILKCNYVNLNIEFLFYIYIEIFYFKEGRLFTKWLIWFEF